MVVLAVLTNFGYTRNDLNMLKVEELEDLYNHVNKYIWAKIFEEFKQKDINHFDCIKKAISEGDNTRLIKLIPNFYDYVRKYGREIIRQ